MHSGRGLTVAENAAFPLKVQGVARDQRRARAAESLSLLRIDSLADLRPERLTPLQRQRVALARALVSAPELLILDEPFARLEPRARDELRDEIVRLHGETDTTTLVLTRDAREALAVANRLAVLDLGRVVQAGAPSDVYNRPADAFVARLFGPANLLQGQVEGTDARGDLVVRTPFGRLVGQTAAGPLTAGVAVTVAIRPGSPVTRPGAPARTGSTPRSSASRVSARRARSTSAGPAIGPSSRSRSSARARPCARGRA